jgi:hypothetical protein
VVSSSRSGGSEDDFAEFDAEMANMVNGFKYVWFRGVKLTLRLRIRLRLRLRLRGLLGGF